MKMRSTIVLIYLEIVFHQAIIIQTQPVNIVQMANAVNFTKLVEALQKADLVKELNGTGPLMVFAPNDAAFDKLGTTFKDLLKTENKEKLIRILKYHVIGNSNLTSTQILGMNLPTRIKTLEGNNVTIRKDGKSIKVDNAIVIEADIIASNGIIHVIDTVLMPPPSSNSVAYLCGYKLLFSVLAFAMLGSFLRF